MRILAALAVPILLTACASTSGMFAQPDPKLVDIHLAAKQRITYDRYFKKDWRYIPVDTKATGNCAVFATTVYVDAIRSGFKPDLIHLCRLPDGTGHAYTSVNGWALDNRFKFPIPVADQDCVDVGPVSKEEVVRDVK